MTGDPSLPTVGSWEFWRRRLGRAVLVGALAFGAVQLFPTLAEDQRVEIIAPEGSLITELHLTYSSEAESESLAWTEIRPPQPSARLEHRVRLPSGDYSIQVSAKGNTKRGEAQAWNVSRPVTLTGELTTFPLGGKSH